MTLCCSAATRPWHWLGSTSHWPGHIPVLRPCGWSSATNDSMARPCCWDGCRIPRRRFVCPHDRSVTRITDAEARFLRLPVPTSPCLTQIAGVTWALLLFIPSLFLAAHLV